MAVAELPEEILAYQEEIRAFAVERLAQQLSDAEKSGYWGDDSSGTSSSLTDIGGQTWYDTGDLGEYDEAGMILFCGRRDRMVKRHGYRIELGEIE